MGAISELSRDRLTLFLVCTLEVAWEENNL